MYEEFLNAILTYVQALNTASKEIGSEDSALTPYVQFIPVLLESELCGFLNDEIGGAYSYVVATEEQREWWKARP